MHDLIFFLTGIVVGAMNAVAGGGMLVGFPIFVGLGISPLMTTATGSVITTPGQIASAWGYRKYLKQVPWRFAFLFIPLILGTIGGSYVLRHTSPDDFAKVVPGLVLFGVLLFAFQPLLHFHVRQHLRGKHRTLTPLFWIGLAFFPLAFYGGYFGAGFGFIMLAFLSLAHLPEVHTINAMKNVGAIAVSGTSIICLYSSGLIHWRIGLVAGAGAVIGGYGGSRFSQRLSSHWLRVIVITIGLGAVVYLGLQRY